MSIYGNITGDSVFAEDTQIDDNFRLKNVKPIREAFIVNELSYLSKDKLKEYVHSSHARALVENEIISADALEQLTRQAETNCEPGHDHDYRNMQYMICHIANENGDDRWDEIVRHRAEERRLMDDLIRDYYDTAKQTYDGYHDEFVDKYIPKSYQT
jgi:hypothetical protein